MTPTIAPEEFPCPACGFLTFNEPPGSYDICKICGWEDDPVQLAHPRMQGGANRESLYEAQTKVVSKYPLTIQELDGVKRDPQWRLPTEEEAAVRADAPKSGHDYFEATATEEPGYYWRQNGDRKLFEHAMAQVSDAPPDEQDQL